MRERIEGLGNQGKRGGVGVVDVELKVKVISEKVIAKRAP